MMSEQERGERRTQILGGISQGSKITDIATQLGVSLIVVKKEMRDMRYDQSSDLRDAREIAYRKNQVERGHESAVQSDRFMAMTGMTFQEKTYRNMVEFYKPELKRIIESSDQSLAIMKLSKSVLRTLRSNGIIIHTRRLSEISPKARSQLA